MSSKFSLQALADCVANWDRGVMSWDETALFSGDPRENSCCRTSAPTAECAASTRFVHE